MKIGEHFGIKYPLSSTLLCVYCFVWFCSFYYKEWQNYPEKQSHALTNIVWTRVSVPCDSTFLLASSNKEMSESNWQTDMQKVYFFVNVIQWPKEGVVKKGVHWNGMELHASLNLILPSCVHAGLPAIEEEGNLTQKLNCASWRLSWQKVKIGKSQQVSVYQTYCKLSRKEKAKC